MKVKILSAWFGPKPIWYRQFVAQMARFKVIDWEPIPIPAQSWKEQVNWLNSYATEILGVSCNKGMSGNDTCDIRPTYGELFAEQYRGYDWWGWCDLDMLFGDLDRLLPELLTNDCEVINFKPDYLSGCFVLFRNVPEITRLWRKGKYREILGEEQYHCWDESGYKHYPGESFYNLLLNEGFRINNRPDLYGYDARHWRQPIEVRE